MATAAEKAKEKVAGGGRDGRLECAALPAVELTTEDLSWTAASSCRPAWPSPAVPPSPPPTPKKSRPADRRYAPAPLGPQEIQAALDQGRLAAGEELRPRRLPQGHGGAERRQDGLHGSGRGPGAAGRRGGFRHRPVQGLDKTKMAGAVISGRPASDGFKKYVGRFKGSKHIKGLRQVLHNDGTKAGYCLEPAFVKGIQLLGELGLSFDLCMRPGELADAAKLIERVPRHALHPRPLRQRQRADEGPHRLAEGHGRGGEAQERRLQGVGHRRLGEAGGVERRRPGADRQPHAGDVRPGPGDVRRRLAGLHAGRDLQAVGRGAEGRS